MNDYVRVAMTLFSRLYVINVPLGFNSTTPQGKYMCALTYSIRLYIYDQVYVLM